MDQLISVIIPIYNVQKYLPRCIESILAQSYQNLEIILVNDGSPDDCLNISKQYETCDSRIVIINKKNGGLSDARNAGIETATGSLLSFIDSDDYIHPQMLERLKLAMESNKADVSICSYKKVYNFAPIEFKFYDSLQLSTRTLSGFEAMEALFVAGNYGSVMAWNKLYKRNLFIDNAIRYPIGRCHEDVFTTYKIYYYCNNISYMDEQLYYYYQRPNSIMGMKFSEKRMDVLYALQEAQQFIGQHNLPLLPQIQCNEILTYINFINIIVQANTIKIHKNYLLNFRNKLLAMTPHAEKNSYLSKKHKCGIVVLRKSLYLYEAFVWLFFKWKRFSERRGLL